MKQKNIDWVDEYRGSLSDRGIREHFRRYSRQSRGKFENAVARLRQRAHPSRYDSVLRSLVTTASSQVVNLFSLGRRRFADLASYGEPFTAIPLESELRWSARWLNVRSRELSKFRVVANEISELVGMERFDEALSALAAYQLKVGYSFWQVELQIALTGIARGVGEVKDFVAELRKSCPSNSIPGFVAYLVGDRNDEHLPYDAFYSRCKQNLPRMNMDEWLKAYMLYRGLQHYDLNAASMAQNLRNERRSCLIDLYETFVETCMTICTSNELRGYRAHVLAALDLLDDIEDPRLLKIRLYAGGGWDDSLRPAGGEKTAWSDLHPFLLFRGEAHSQFGQSALRTQLHSDLAEVWNKGSGADKAVARLLKFGVNLKSLDIGIAIASHAERQSSKSGPLMLIAAGAPFCLSGVSIEEVYGAPVDLSQNILLSFVERQEDNTEASRALAVVGGTERNLTGISELGKLWVAHVCLADGKYATAKQAADELSRAGPRWAREATKHQFVSAYTRGDLKTACSVLAGSLVKDRALSVELPITEMFLGKKWKDFAALDSVEVGIAAHFAVDAPAASPVGFILSSCCRSVLRAGRREMLDGAPVESMSEQERDVLVLFFAEVWSENVLARTGAFETTHDVRVERLQVVRRLLDWDKAHEDDYKEVIKALTLDEALWQGVKHVNETRVFVNEPAISRWAEKELLEEYKRWLELIKVELPAEEVTEERVLEYLAATINASGGMTAVERVTENDALFASLVTRLQYRFLTDPTDGLNCYLSVRVRHGSLLRALFGPSEAIDLLVGENEPEDLQLQRVGQLSGAKGGDIGRVHEAVVTFADGMRSVGAELIRERIQLLDGDHPKGLFRSQLHYATIVDRLAKPAQFGFPFLLEAAYFAFWQSLSGSLEEARRHINTEVKDTMSAHFDRLITALRDISSVEADFVSAVTQASTQTRFACDQAANWFQLPNMREALTFNLEQAVAVATRVAQTLNPGFDPIVIPELPEKDLPLASLGLSAIVDCLLVIFDNVWEHSGTGNRPEVRLKLAVIDDVLWLDSENKVSAEVLSKLQHGLLQSLQDRLSNGGESGLASTEGGSGLAKMKRLTKSVEATPDSPVFKFGLHDDKPIWFVRLGMKLRKSEGDVFYVY